MIPLTHIDYANMYSRLTLSLGAPGCGGNNARRAGGVARCRRFISMSKPCRGSFAVTKAAVCLLGAPRRAVVAARRDKHAARRRQGRGRAAPGCLPTARRGTLAVTRAAGGDAGAACGGQGAARGILPGAAAFA